MTKLEHFMHLIFRDLNSGALSADDAARMVEREAPVADSPEASATLSVLKHFIVQRRLELKLHQLVKDKSVLPPCDHDECGPAGCKRRQASIAIDPVRYGR